MQFSRRRELFVWVFPVLRRLSQAESARRSGRRESLARASWRSVSPRTPNEPIQKLNLHRRTLFK